MAEHVSKVEPIASLISATDRLRASNDKLEDELRKDRGSLPPSAPKLAAAPATITPVRARAIAKAVKNNHTMLTLVSLVDVEGGPLTPAEFQVWADLAAKGAQQP